MAFLSQKPHELAGPAPWMAAPPALARRRPLAAIVAVLARSSASRIAASPRTALLADRSSMFCQPVVLFRQQSRPCACILYSGPGPLMVTAFPPASTSEPSFSSTSCNSGMPPWPDMKGTLTVAARTPCSVFTSLFHALVLWSCLLLPTVLPAASLRHRLP